MIPESAVDSSAPGGTDSISGCSLHDRQSAQPFLGQAWLRVRRCGIFHSLDFRLPLGLGGVPGGAYRGFRALS